MNRKKYLIITTVLSLLCVNKAYAACTQQEINEFKKIEDEYKITYEFDKQTKDYILVFKTPLEKKYDFIIYTNTNLNCKKINEEKTECYNIKPDEYKIGIVGITNTCKDELKSIKLELSRYNNFSEDPLCQGNEEFVLCQPTYDKEIDYETFISRIKTYIKTKNNKNPIEEQNEESNKDILKQYIKENLLTIIIVVMFVILIIITTVLTIKSIRKSRRLE